MERKLKILCFAELGEKIGKCVEISMETEITVSGLIERLIKMYPEYQHSIQSCMIAVNQKYVKVDTVIRSDDQVALIPPVSGG
ncbi:molybdopterin converting factor small subunit [Collibacillus ludicampi]|uniref:Molybdopterin synthase sulfur carrier subunit n=1 Tax=Collibacillus ludicampi TaxID=2771369 RepID=A0AAV4LBU7_9BACL|nr:molybdopterin converting factor subunit 1 [Collibacillus ludicampi]GIM44952.1 molybdopterin converting factor small subunit [Collibacillus ludicampi]